MQFCGATSQECAQNGNPESDLGDRLQSSEYAVIASENGEQPRSSGKVCRCGTVWMLLAQMQAYTCTCQLELWGSSPNLVLRCVEVQVSNLNSHIERFRTKGQNHVGPSLHLGCYRSLIL